MVRRLMAGIVAACLSAVPALESVAGGVTVSGVVTRGPAEGRGADVPARYGVRHRETSTEDAPAPDCRCDPGRFAVVSLHGDHLEPPSPPSPPPTMAQKDRMFVPSVLAVPVGATVEFPNLDPFFHNVFSYSKTCRFDLGRYPQGRSARVVFERPGVVPVFCEIHYSMRAYIHVLDTPFFAVTDELRRFEIPGVPPGEYVLRVWQENLPELRRSLEVESGPLHVEVP